MDKTYKLMQLLSMIPLLPVLGLLSSCSLHVDPEAVKKEVLNAEKAFEAMAAEKSIAEAFAWFAAEDAVIKRGNDSIISGREGIRNYYSLANLTRATVSWTPDRIDVSADGTMAWTYGKYVWKVIRSDGDTVVSRGIFHTVWKRQSDGSWKYVWD